MKQLAIILISILVSSCSFFIKKIGGIHDPKMESVHSINEYSKKLTLDSANIVFAKDSISQLRLHKLFGGAPELLIFNQAKKFIPYKNDSLSCNASIDHILQNICSANKMEMQTSRKVDYDTLLKCISDPNQCFRNFDLQNFDYLVLMNYTKYADGVSKSHIIPWNKVIAGQKADCRVKYVFVDLDYMNTWGMKKKSLPHLRVTR